MSLVTPPSPNYHKLFNEIFATPKSAAVFFDNELACLLQDGIQQDIHHFVYLLGEALLRSWLYAGHAVGNDILQKTEKHISASLLSKFKDLILKHANAIKREGINTRALQPDKVGLDEQDSKIWQFLLERIQGYCEADGLIPVVNPATPSEALLLPFRVFRSSTQPGEVLDASEQVIGNWGNRLKAVHHLFDYQPLIVLSCHCGQRAVLIEGNSMILPICMAMTRKANQFPDFAIWDVIATGALTPDGTLETVGGLAGKADIAQRVGARLFICPATHTNSTSIDTLPISPYTPLADCFRRMADALTDRGLGKLDSRQALTKLKELKNDIHEGLLILCKALPRLERYEAALKDADPFDDYTQECHCIALLIRGAIANHAGNPANGKAYLDQSIALINKYNLDLEHHYHAIANAVVSLTDLGLLDDAETEGRILLNLVETMQASTDVKNRARMTASGAVGGQPLLQKALQSPAIAEESLTLLTKAYNFAVKLCDPKEQARDAVQIALWHALINTESAAAEITIAEQRLEALHTHGESSLPFLLNYRFLAAYRLLLLQNTTTPGFQSWPLPETGPSWVRAVALKYRGTLHTGAGNIEQAKQDFQQAFTKLDATNMPLLRFIGATSALQAAQSLRETNPETSRNYATKALERFTALETTLHGIHRDPAWKTSALAIIEQTKTIESPQIYYRY